jgi:hypothetical protein
MVLSRAVLGVIIPLLGMTSMARLGCDRVGSGGVGQTLEQVPSAGSPIRVRPAFIDNDKMRREQPSNLSLCHAMWPAGAGSVRVLVLVKGVEMVKTSGS